MNVRTHAHCNTYTNAVGWVVVVAMWNRSGGLVGWIAAALALGGYN